MKKLDFLPNLRNRYSIRRFTVGTASILIGSLLFLGHNGEAKAAENTNDNTVVEASKDTSQTQQETVNNTTPQENTSETLQQDKDTQAIQNELESVKTEAVSKFAIFTHLSEDARQQYIAEVKQAQSKADVLAVVDKAQKAEEELVKQAEQAKQADQTKQVEQEKPEKPADTANAQTETKAETESVKTEEKTEPSSATASETPKTSEAETVTTPNNTTPSIDATPLSTVQKVDKVKKELAPNYDSSKVDEALAIIDTNDLTVEQIKAEILTILLAQGSVEKDLYSPQATLPKSEEGNTRYAVRAASDIDADQQLYQEALNRLNSAITDAKGTDKTGYTTSSVAALEKAIKSGETAAANAKSTPSKLDKASIAITKAKAQLTKIGNKDELKKAIDIASKFVDLDLSDNEDNYVHDRRDIATTAYNDNDVDQDYVDGVTNDLNDAIYKKLYQDALEELNATIKDVETVDKTIYTPETVTVFEAAVNDGTTKAADTATTPEQLKAATQAIKDAKDALKQKADKGELNNSIATTEALQPLQAGDTEDDAVKTALEKAKTVQSNENADQTTVDAAKNELDNAVNAKKAADAKDAQDAAAAKQAALDVLKSELTKVKALDKNAYTINTVTSLTNKADEGQAIVDAPDAKTTEEIKAAT